MHPTLRALATAIAISCLAACTAPVNLSIQSAPSEAERTEEVAVEPEPADNQCLDDSDCVVTLLDDECCSSCIQVIQTRAEAEAHQEYCETYERLFPCPPTQCALDLITAVCDEGRCMREIPTPPPPAVEEPAETDEPEEVVEEEPQEVTDRAPPERPDYNNSCESVSDCVTAAISADCCDTCGDVAYNRTYFEKLREYCSGAGRPDQCPSLSCAFEHRIAACKDGQCVTIRDGSMRGPVPLH